MLKMDEKYTNGLFRGGANTFAYDILHDDMAEANFDIYNYLSSRIPGLGQTNSNTLGEAKIFYYRTQNVHPNIYIDEHEEENSILQNIPISQIAYVKLIANINTLILAFYLKKGDDLIDHRAMLTDMGVVKVPGYSPGKEFYVPDYSQTNDAIGNDSRTTLLWQPNIFTGKNYTTVPITFYNNDFSKRIKIVLEGTNDEGKLIHIEKIIE